MEKHYTKYFKQYSELIQTIEENVKALSGQHSKHMMCKKGCDMCCMDYSIFPLEFHFILNKLKTRRFDSTGLNSDKDQSCVFLLNHLCQIYQERPVICRTHGLPLLYTNNDGEWELSACELNFTDFDFSLFTLDNTYPQDKFNSKLYMLNRAFVAEFDEKSYKENELIPIKKLLEYL